MDKILSLLVIAIVAVTIYAFCTIDDSYQAFDNGIDMLNAKDATAKAERDYQLKLDSIKRELK